MPKTPDDSCIFMAEYDDGAKRALGRDTSAEATLAYILLGKKIGLHPAYMFQNKTTRDLILTSPKYFLEGQEVEVILGNSKSTIEYQLERIEKVKQIDTPPCCSNTELEQYNKFTDDEIKRLCGLFDKHIVERGAVHPVVGSSDEKFRKLVRDDIELVRNFRYGFKSRKHLGALIKDYGSHRCSSELDDILNELVQLSQDTSHTFSCDSIIAILIENQFDQIATKAINDKLHILHWIAHEGRDLIVPLVQKLDTKEPHPLDPELFWLTLSIFLGKNIVDTFLGKSWEEQLSIARELRQHPNWRTFTDQYIGIVETLGQYDNLEPEKIKSKLKECRPTNIKAIGDICNKWEVIALVTLLCSLGSGTSVIFLDPGILQNILALFTLLGTGAGISSVKKTSSIYRGIIQGIRQAAEYDTGELKRLLKSKLDMLR